MYVFMCVCMYVCICMYIYIYIYTEAPKYTAALGAGRLLQTLLLGLAALHLLGGTSNLSVCPSIYIYI